MNQPFSRRRFLQGTAAGAVSLFIGCQSDGQLVVGDTPPPAAGVPVADPGKPLMTWVKVTEDNRAIIAMHKAEMGQGVHNALTLLVAEEMDLSAAQIQVEIVPELAPYTLGTGLPMTYGSTSVSGAYLPFRKVGATARALLVQAAAARWGIPPDAVSTKEGQCLGPDGQVLAYHELVEEAALLTPPEDPPLKAPEDFTLIGKDHPRHVDQQITAGTAVYGIDVTPPEGLYAAIRHAPTPQGVPTGVDALRADDPGVRAIVALPHAVAVVADSYWTAQKVVDALPVTFETPAEDREISSDSLLASLQAGLDEAGLELERMGDIDAGLSGASQSISAEYRVPHIAHVTMEPVNATAQVSESRCELWLPTQAPGLVRSAALKATGLEGDQVSVYPTLLGGGFGRKANTDYAEAAIQIAQAVEGPVTLIWSREEDMRRDRYRPAYLGRITGGVDEAGKLIAWDAVNCGDSVLGFGEGDPLSAQGLSSLPYAIPNQRNRHVYVPSPIASGFWRSIGHSQNTFFVESFMDELAHLAGRDPVDFRLELLDEHPRVKQVLERVAALANWGSPSVAGAGQGVAICDDYGSMTAVVCEASYDAETKAITVHRFSAAVDCGVVIEPDGVRAQIEGGLLFGLSAALHEEITFDQGEAVQGNLDTYPILRPAEAPEVVIEIIASEQAPGGVGELSVGAAAPALANALFASAGLRCRRLPLSHCLTEMG